MVTPGLLLLSEILDFVENYLNFQNFKHKDFPIKLKPYAETFYDSCTNVWWTRIEVWA